MVSNTDNRDSAIRPVGWLLTALFFCCWFFLYADGFWAYVQHIAAGKKVIPASLFVLILSAALLAKMPKKDGISWWFVGLIYFFVCWLFLVLLVTSNSILNAPVRTFFGFYVYYWPLILALISAISNFRVDRRYLIALGFVAGLPVLALGFAQGIFKDSFAIGRWISEEGGAFNLGFFGNRRANSIFAHSEDFGFFSAMIASVALAYLVARRGKIIQKIISATVFLGALACVYLTYTRAAYMMVAFALFTVLLFRFWSRRDDVKWIPALYLLAAALLYFSSPIINYFSNQTGVFSSASLGDRLYGNAYYMNELVKGGVSSFFVGLGWILNANYRSVVPIDNQFMAVVLNTGIVGLLFWLAATIGLWLKIYERASKEDDALVIGLAGTASVWLGLAFFNTSSIFLFISIICLALIPRRNHETLQNG